jgi:Zn-dependent protease
MSPFIWLSVWLVGLIASIAFHEWAHVVVAKAYGWTYNGIVFKPWVAAVGVKLETDREDKRGLWQIALAGPVATFIAAFIALYIGGLPVEGLQKIMPSLVAFNVAVGLINLVPSPITDGGHIVTSLTGWTMKWRYTIALWLGVEFIILWYFLV